MTTKTGGPARVSEVLAALAPHGALGCVPQLTETDGQWQLTLTFMAGEDVDDALTLLGLADDLRYVIDIAQLRALADRYGIDPAALEALLTRRPGDAGWDE